jgi:hypothetical protein
MVAAAAEALGRCLHKRAVIARAQGIPLVWSPFRSARLARPRRSLHPTFLFHLFAMKTFALAALAVLAAPALAARASEGAKRDGATAAVYAQCA